MMKSANGFATLDAGLLARKGEAIPALSQETKLLADAGIMPDQHPLAPAWNPNIVTDHTLQNVGADDKTVQHQSQPQSQSNPELIGKGADSVAGLGTIVRKVSPVEDDIVDPVQKQSACPIHKANIPCAKKILPKLPGQTPDMPATARVTFRMPMAEFLRLKLAGVVLEKPCREIVLDALSFYLTECQVRDFRHCQCLKTPSGDKA